MMRSRPLLAILGASAAFIGCGDLHDADDSAQITQGIRRRETRCNDEVRICHFPSGKRAAPKIITVDERALAAHVAHGDGLAPDRLRRDADCLVPLTPSAAVSVIGKSDTEGGATLLVPDTNIRVKVHVENEAGDALFGVAITAVAVGADYLVVAEDASARSVAFAEGSLFDARPGSALTVSVDLVLGLLETTFPGVGSLASGLSFSQFIRNHFIASSDACYTQPEFRSQLEQQCIALLSASTARTTLSFLAAPAAVPAVAVTSGIWSGLSFGKCLRWAELTSSDVFGSKDLPLKFREYRPPFLPGVDYFPLLFEVLGTCGGGCCSPASASACSNVSSPRLCATDAVGGYHEHDFCSAELCNADLATSAVAAPTDLDVGGQASFQFSVTNQGPGDALGVTATIQLPTGVAGNALFAIDSAGTSRPCFTSASSITCPIGRLANGSEVTIEGGFTTTEPGAVFASLAITSSTSDGNAANDTALASWHVECPDAEPVWNATTRSCEACPGSSPRWNPQTMSCETACPSLFGTFLRTSFDGSSVGDWSVSDQAPVYETIQQLSSYASRTLRVSLSPGDGVCRLHVAIEQTFVGPLPPNASSGASFWNVRNQGLNLSNPPVSIPATPLPPGSQLVGISCGGPLLSTTFCRQGGSTPFAQVNVSGTAADLQFFATASTFDFVASGSTRAEVLFDVPAP